MQRSTCGAVVVRGFRCAEQARAAEPSSFQAAAGV